MTPTPQDKLAEAVAELRRAFPVINSPWTGEDFALNGTVDPIDHAIATILNAVLSGQLVPAQPLQARVKPWMTACFGEEVSNDRLERGDRLLEEVFELLQSGDYPRDRITALASYVWSREVGEPAQEVGGVMITIAAYCLAYGLDMHEAGETELARIWTKVDVIRAKHAAKPKGSALPQEWPAQPLPEPQPIMQGTLNAGLVEVFGRWRNGYAFNEDSEEDVELAARATPHPAEAEAPPVESELIASQQRIVSEAEARGYRRGWGAYAEAVAIIAASKGE